MSGGIWRLGQGYGLMLGGAREHVDAVLPLIRALPGLAFDRPDSTRKQDRWQTTDQVIGVGSSELHGQGGSRSVSARAHSPSIVILYSRL